MIYLLLATLCSASIALIFKYTEGRKTNRMVITTSNYFFAFMITLGLIYRQGFIKEFRLTGEFTAEIKTVFMNENAVLSPTSSMIWGALLGIFAGVFFYASFIFYQKSVRANGAGLSGAFAKIGILIPMVFSIVLWREYPGAMQGVGIFLAIISILMVNFPDKGTIKKEGSTKGKSLLLLLFIFGGFAGFSNKIYQHYGLVEFKDVFLFFVFITAFLISFKNTYGMKRKIYIMDLLIGLIVGIPNLFSSYFLILSLERLPASVAYPVFSAGGIVLITLGSGIIFKEKPEKKHQWAIALTVIAMIFINL